MFIRPYLLILLAFTVYQLSHASLIMNELMQRLEPQEEATNAGADTKVL